MRTIPLAIAVLAVASTRAAQDSASPARKAPPLAANGEPSAGSSGTAKPPGGQASLDSGPLPGQTVVRWQPGTANMLGEYLDGQFIQSIDAGGLAVSVSLADMPKATRVEIVVVNGTTRSYTVFPDRVRLMVTFPKTKDLLPRDPNRIIASIVRGEHWRSALDEGASSMQTEQVTTQSRTNGNIRLEDNRGATVDGRYGGTTTSTSTRPDWNARRAAAMRTAGRRSAAESDVDFISRSALRTNTIRPGRDIAGLIWFDKDSLLKNKQARVIVRVPMDTVIFEFPLERTGSRHR